LQRRAVRRLVQQHPQQRIERRAERPRLLDRLVEDRCHQGEEDRRKHLLMPRRRGEVERPGAAVEQVLGGKA
jgi:hypothetical protein